MLKRLYAFAAPKYFYERSYRWHTVLGTIAFVMLVVGVVCGLFLTPADYQQSDAFRLIYIHVPCAMWSMSLYVGMGGLALALLVWRVKLAGILLLNTAQLGAWLTFLALVTGSIWGKPMWGTWWVWDARLTSELILLFLYLGILSLGYAYPNREKAERMAAIITLVGLVDLPIIHYSVYWWSTLHQGATLFLFEKPKIHPSMAYPLFIILIALGVYSIWLIFYKTRSEIILRDYKQQWVKALLTEGHLR